MEAAVPDRPSTDTPWWRDAVCYEIYVRSFADADGDGVGDLPGITERLPHLADLGVDALWITPFYPSPQHDHGYDVSDYCDVEPQLGRLEDFDALTARAHELGLHVIVDLVPNHTSSAHPWFEAALASAPGSPERARYLFRDSQDGPPNNWHSVFGGPAWTQVPDGQWYLHLFDTHQPDLDWTHPDVPRMFEDVLPFWLDRGVDGFRIDVAHGLFKESGLPDQRLTEEEREAADPAAEDESMMRLRPGHEPMWDQPEVHEVYRAWRRLFDSYAGDRMAVGEAWTRDAESLARYVRPDELHQSFNFHWLTAPWSAEAFRDVILETLGASSSVGASPTWVLSNHDVVRHPTRYGGGAVGLARARAALMTMLALPGSAYLYQGEELGLPEVALAPEDRRDPRSIITGTPGRDGCRVPIPWSGEKPPFGFGPGEGQPWLPQPTDWSALTVEAQAADPGSMLSFYRRALRARREMLADLASLPEEPAVHVHGAADELVIRRGPWRCHLNTSASPIPTEHLDRVLDGATVMLCSGEEPGAPDTATWLRS